MVCNGRSLNANWTLKRRFQCMYLRMRALFCSVLFRSVPFVPDEEEEEEHYNKHRRVYTFHTDTLTHSLTVCVSMCMRLIYGQNRILMVKKPFSACVWECVRVCECAHSYGRECKRFRQKLLWKLYEICCMTLSIEREREGRTLWVK